MESGVYRMFTDVLSRFIIRDSIRLSPLTPSSVKYTTQKTEDENEAKADHPTTPLDHSTTPLDHPTTPLHHPTTPLDHPTTPLDNSTTPLDLPTSPLDHSTTEDTVEPTKPKVTFKEDQNTSNVK